ncbi:hypothetical protein TrLO_g11090 [Triparma laevis f. longispina]|uniref:Uncharacterized protein n=1 Tax=Triparma laevis f. longispina TaxID=1714387 RepID=A0A9W7KVB5_9STRA|nr:hypothetical protein TrLO_g11090 [Triparma laevis f. longispina]
MSALHQPPTTALPTINDTLEIIHYHLLPSDLYTLCFTSKSIKQYLLSVRPSLSLLISERIIDYDTGKFPLNAITSKVLGVPVQELSQGNLHECMGVEPPGPAASKGPWRHLVNERWKHSPHRPELEQCYLQWLHSVIGPLMISNGETEMYYSRELLIRYHTPYRDNEGEFKNDIKRQQCEGSARPYGKRKGINRPGISTKRHADRDYGHPTGEVNVWLPVNDRVWGGNSLWRDRTVWEGERRWEGEESSRAFELRFGEAILWYGNGCKHETRKNDTEVTRVSFDFRVIPGSLFEKRAECRTFDERGNYFLRMDLMNEL